MVKLDLIICARGNSKGIPNKNSRLFGEYTLIEKAVKTSIESKFISNVIVSSEDKIILDQAAKSGANYLHIRNKNLSNDDVRQVEVVLELIKYYRKKSIFFTNYLVLLQTTTPFITPNDIDNAISKHLQFDSCQIVSGYQLDINPCELFIEKNNKSIERIFQSNIKSRQRQLQPKLYRLNGGLRIFNTETLLKEKEFFNESEDVFIYQMSKEKSLNLDSMIDWEIGLNQLKDSI